MKQMLVVLGTAFALMLSGFMFGYTVGYEKGVVECEREVGEVGDKERAAREQEWNEILNNLRGKAVGFAGLKVFWPYQFEKYIDRDMAIILDMRTGEQPTPLLVSNVPPFYKKGDTIEIAPPAVRPWR